MRNVQISGKIAGFEGAIFYQPEHTDANGKTKKAFCRARINVSMDYKEEGSKYDKTELMTIQAFGWLADRLSKFVSNDYIVLHGKLAKTQERVTEDNRVYPAEWIIVADNIDNWPSVNVMTETTTETTNQSQTQQMPSLGNKPSLGGNKPSLGGNKPSLGGNRPSLGGNKPSLSL